MSQLQYTNHEADIISYPLRDALIGIINPGRYFGYKDFSEYQAQSGDNVYVRISHTNGIKKYDESTPPALEANRSIAVTTQGTIIADDENRDFTIPLTNGGCANGVWHIIYMEHNYIQIAGSNPATFGVKSGADDAVIPILDSVTKQVPIVYIKEIIGATTYAELEITPAQCAGHVGDFDFGKKLWGDDGDKYLSEVLGKNMGSIPSEGIFGRRIYTEQNYVDNGESITTSLDALDVILFDTATTLAELKLDDLQDPDDNTDLDVSLSAHGLCPKLPPVNGTYLDDNGNWTAPPGKRLVWRDQVVTADFGKSDFGNFAAANGLIDLSSIVPSDCDIAWIRVTVRSVHSTATSAFVLGFHKDAAVGGPSNIELEASGTTEETKGFLSTIMGINTANKTFRWYIDSGDPEADCASISVLVLAWQTAS